MEAFKKDKDQGVGKPARKRDYSGDLEQRKENDQCLDDWSEDDGGDWFVGMHIRIAELPAEQPMNP